MPKAPKSLHKLKRKPKSLRDVQYDKDRGTSAERGYDSHWRKRRKEYLSDHKLCERCKARGVTEAPKVVHHRTPLKDGGTHDDDNLMAVCRTCHEIMHGRKRPRGG